MADILGHRRLEEAETIKGMSKRYGVILMQWGIG